MVQLTDGHEPTGQERAAPARARMELSEAFTELGRLALWDTTLTDVMRRVAGLAQASIDGADEVSITLIDGDRPGTVAFTGELAVQLDERQYDNGFGPCMDAARGGEVIFMRDLAQEQRYPDFVGAALRAGVTATLSVGLPVPSRVVGGLNVYQLDLGAGGTSGVLNERSVQQAESFASYAAIALANAGLVHSTQQFAEQMQEAMASRAVIEQAKGIMIGRTGCSPEDAFQMLVAESRQHNRKLAAVAAELLAEAQEGSAELTG